MFRSPSVIVYVPVCLCLCVCVSLLLVVGVAEDCNPPTCCTEDGPRGSQHDTETPSSIEYLAGERGREGGEGGRGWRKGGRE